MVADDPWDWPIDRVVQELCTVNRSWQPRSASMRIPDPTNLEISLRENEVSGDVLLLNVDDAVLKEDFGLRVLAWRSFVHHAISELRLKSIQYHAYIQKHHSHITVRSEISRGIQDFFQQQQQSRYGPASELPLGPSHQIGFGSITSPESGSIPSASAPKALPDVPSPETDKQLASDEGIVSDEPYNKRRRLDLPNADEDLVLETEDGLSDQIQLPDNQVQNRASTPAPEFAPEGKKRKRIAPTLITSEIDPKRNREVPTEADSVIYNHPKNFVEPGVSFVGNDGKKRLVPIRQSDPISSKPDRYDDNFRKPSFGHGPVFTGNEEVPPMSINKLANITGRQTSKPAADSLSTGYLGTKSMPVEQLFYEGVATGEELETSNGITEFYEAPRHISTGRRRYVYNMMKNLHRSERKVFRRGGKFFSAVQPYREKLTPKFQKPSFTLYFATPDGEIHARREDVPAWPEINSETSQTPQSAGDERATTFNPLGPDMLNGLGSYDNWDPSSLEKYRHLEGGDEILPLYGESDEENEYDLATWKEIEDERGAKLDRPLKSTKRQHLNHVQINEAIDEGIAQLVAKWKNKVLPKRERRAWSLWTKSRKRGTKRLQIVAAQRDREGIVQRIAKLRNEISTEVWTSKLQVQRQTRIMETNVFTREDLAWKISVLEQKAGPERPPQTPSIVRSKKSTVLSEDGEEGESIESESDASSSEDGLGDFVVADEGHLTFEDELELNLADSEDENEEDITMSDANPSENSSRESISALGNFVTPTKSARNERRTSKSQSPSAAANNHITRPLKGEGMALPKLSTISPNGSPELIDLTMLSSDDTPQAPRFIDLVTPRKNQQQIKLKHRNSPFKGAPINISDEDSERLLDENNLPPYSDPAGIAGYSWTALGVKPDRERLVIKVMYSMTDQRRHTIFSFVSVITERSLWSGMCQILESYIEGESNVKGIDTKTTDILTTFARLFQIYALGQYQSMWDREHLPNTGALQAIIDGYDDWFSSFYRLCCNLEGYFSNKSRPCPVSDRASESEEDDEEGPRSANRRRPLNLTTSEDDIPEEETPRKKKKPIFEDADARDMREREQTRRAEQEARRKKLHANLDFLGYGDDEDQGRIIINDAAMETQGFLYVNEHIARRIKKHQIEGVRFLWNQIITEDKVLQGCLLAHTMGLGKTMQVITLLVAIAEASASDNASISSQIPERLRDSRTLVLCPPTLIDNWMDELLTWVEPNDLLGDLWKVDASITPKDRLRTISKWHQEGGVLLIGYDMFRNFIANKRTTKREAPLSEEEHERILRELVEGPNIVIADEAHKMKNADAAITKAAVQFNTKCRIALTGSPLANNVEEYHTMIDWVAPNYLGPAREFRAKYVEPIQTGLYGDSAPYEKRKALKMLGVLKEDLAPKVHRADMSVLKNDLPPKREFTITVPLTELQRKAYALYVRSMISGNAALTKDGEVTQTTVWHWLAILSLLCNHPACFNAKLNERGEAARKGILTVDDAPSSRDITDTDEIPTGDIDPPIWKVGVSQDLIDGESKLFREEAENINSVDLSNKARILCQILDASKAAGDKALVFSQSIPTLDFLEGICKRQGRLYARLDGKTRMSTRQAQTKEFNNMDNPTEVFLISTTAGGLGLNLPGANRVVIFDFKFNPIMEEQAVGRAYRIGQKKATFVYRFVAGGTFEDSVHNKTIFKQQLASRVVDKKRPMAMAKKRLGDFLFEPKYVEQTDLSEFQGMDPLVLDKILASQAEASTIRAVVQSDTFERDDDDKLTAEEEKEVKQLLDDEQLKRSDPKKWSALQLMRSHRARVQQTQQIQQAMAQQHAALRSNIALLGYNPGMSSAQQPYSNGAIRRGDETVILPPPPTLRFAPQGYTNDKPPTQAIHRPHSTAPITPGDRPQSLGTNNSTQKSSLSSARTRDRSPIAGSNTRVRTATPEYWPAQSSDNGQGMKNATPTGSRPEITPSHSTSNTRILPPNQGKHVEVTPSRVNSSTGILPPTQDHQNSANDLTHPPSHIQLPNDDLRPSSDVSRKPRSRFESLLIESANTSNESTENAIRLSKEIKSLVKQNTANEHDYKTIMGAASGFLEVRANCRALLTGKITPDGFVRTFLKNASERRTLSRNVGQEEKSAMFLAMNRQPVKSLKTPVTKPTKHSHHRTISREDDVREMERVQEHRRLKASGQASPSQAKKYPKIPTWAREEIDEAQARGSANRHHSSRTPALAAKDAPNHQSRRT